MSADSSLVPAATLPVVANAASRGPTIRGPPGPIPERLVAALADRYRIVRRSSGVGRVALHGDGATLPCSPGITAARRACRISGVMQAAPSTTHTLHTEVAPWLYAARPQGRRHRWPANASMHFLID